jgi:hypothetical protein
VTIAIKMLNGITVILPYNEVVWVELFNQIGEGAAVFRYEWQTEQGYMERRLVVLNKVVSAEVIN